MYKYKLTIAYDGTNYGGWQIQPNALSIQELIQNALKTILRKEIGVTGSGRTDAGVHALGQVAHFTFDTEIDTHKLLASLNGILPKDIRVLKIEQVPLDFHARYSAVGKIYHYHLHLERPADPFKRLYAQHVLYPINLDLLKESALFFIGEHDFSSFANELDNKDAIRTIRRLYVIEQKGGVRLEFEGSGFLYKMVRNITGTLLDIARGKIPIQQLPEIFAARDRKKAGSAAPPQGLFLMEVLYTLQKTQNDVADALSIADAMKDRSTLLLCQRP